MIEQDNVEMERQIDTHHSEADSDNSENGENGKIRTWRQDRILFLLLAIIGLSGAGLLMLLIAPIAAFWLDRFGISLPVLARVTHWLDSGFNGLFITIALVLVAIVAVVLLRFRVLRNPSYYVEAGCPQCFEHELIRVRRRRSDRILGYIGMPVQRRVCRNCSWDGLRVGGSYHKISADEATVPQESV